MPCYLRSLKHGLYTAEAIEARRMLVTLSASGTPIARLLRQPTSPANQQPGAPALFGQLARRRGHEAPSTHGRPTGDRLVTPRQPTGLEASLDPLVGPPQENAVVFRWFVIIPADVARLAGGARNMASTPELLGQAYGLAGQLVPHPALLAPVEVPPVRVPTSRRQAIPADRRSHRELRQSPASRGR